MRKLRVAQFGTFDVDNYGDLLFPHIARWRCPEFDWVDVAPLGLSTNFVDASPTVSFEQAEKMDFDAVVIGGGNIISTKKTSLPAYAPMAALAYPSLWVGAASIANERKIPLVFNGPSVLRPFETREGKALARAVFSSASYVAVRDSGSANILGEIAPDVAVSIIPDTVFDLCGMWPFEDGKKAERARYLSIHVNERYYESIERTAAILDSLAATIDAEARFVPIGPCHGDLELAVGIAGAMKRSASVVQPISLHDIEREIAGSCCYVGSSMHGFITSLCASVPALLVLGSKKPMRKFEGMLSEAGLGSNVIMQRWSDIDSEAFKAGVFPSGGAARIKKRLDEHWAKVRSAIVSGSKCSISCWARDWRQIVKTVQIKNRLARSSLFAIKKMFG